MNNYLGEIIETLQKYLKNINQQNNPFNNIEFSIE